MSTFDAADKLTALVSELAETEDERELIELALSMLAHSVEPVVPSADLRERVLARALQSPREARFEADGFYFARGTGIDWVEIAPGIRIKWLLGNPDGPQTALIEMGPNLAFPAHPHPEIEDLYLISGDAWVGDIPMSAGDYCRAPAGTAHNDVRSGPNGSLALVVSR
ncbi:MAG: cupin domain-containing protein [Dehalococcoidia bacterium]|nr:cupin domain-containing protein [Dehalococcoidia bacterium]MCB9485394.1 cupin domain-containing protein [Thermoflexaceae bacterium]